MNIAPESSSRFHDERARELRQGMVDAQLRRRGIRDRRVLEAMTKVPRHHFVPPALQQKAYADTPLPIGHGATISQPLMVASTLEALELRGAERVLDVGAGSGYQTALLCELAAHVYAIEIVTELARVADGRLASLGCTNYTMVTGNGREGYPSAAPFDRIVVAAASSDVPPLLLDQLDVGGRLLIPIGDRGGQVLQRLTKRPDGSIETELLDRCAFVPLVRR